MTHTQLPSRQRESVSSIFVPLIVGGFVAVALGVYGRTHTPTGFAVGLAGFSGPLAMKAWLTTAAALLAIVQVLSAMAMWSKIPVRGDWPALVHRWSGRIAFLLTVPVAFHCLYSLGAQFGNDRVMTHSLLGCFFYGVFTAKMLALPKRGLPGWTLPVLGGLVFTALIGLWLTSSLWFFTVFGLKF